MKELVCGICGEIITNPKENCPYCGAEPNHFVDGETVDRELLRKIYDEGGATYWNSTTHSRVSAEPAPAGVYMKIESSIQNSSAAADRIKTFKHLKI